MTSKPQNVVGGVKKQRLQNVNLNNYQFKTSRYRPTYMDYIVTTNQKITVDIQKLERKEYKHNTK